VSPSLLAESLHRSKLAVNRKVCNESNKSAVCCGAWWLCGCSCRLVSVLSVSRLDALLVVCCRRAWCLVVVALAVVLVGWRGSWAALAAVGGVSLVGSGCVCGAGGRWACRLMLGGTWWHLGRVYA
jgi:hypothetical protein